MWHLSSATVVEVDGKNCLSVGNIFAPSDYIYTKEIGFIKHGIVVISTMQTSPAMVAHRLNTMESVPGHHLRGC